MLIQTTEHVHENETAKVFTMKKCKHNCQYKHNQVNKANNVKNTFPFLPPLRFIAAFSISFSPIS